LPNRAGNCLVIIWLCTVVSIEVACGRLPTPILIPPKVDAKSTETVIAGRVFATLTLQAQRSSQMNTIPTATEIFPSVTRTSTIARTSAEPQSNRTSTLRPTVPARATPTFLPSGFKYPPPELTDKEISQVGGQISLKWKPVGDLLSNENYFVEISEGGANWSQADTVVCQILSHASELLLPPTNTPPCRTRGPGAVFTPVHWWHDNANYGWRVCVVETDSVGKVVRRLSEHNGGWIFWRHQ